MSAGQEIGSPIRENRTLLPAPLPPDEARGTLAAAAGASTGGLRPPFDTPAAAFSSRLSRRSHLDRRAAAARWRLIECKSLTRIEAGCLPPDPWHPRPSEGCGRCAAGTAARRTAPRVGLLPGAQDRRAPRSDSDCPAPRLLCRSRWNQTRRTSSATLRQLST